MLRKWKLLITNTILFFVVISAATQVYASDKALAVVNSQNITQKDYNAFMGIPGDEKKYPVDPEIVSRIVDRELFVQNMREKGLEKDAKFLKLMENLKKTTLFNYGMGKFFESYPVSEKQLRDAYEKEVKTFNQYHLQHIIVASRAEALSVIQEIDKGADFASLARNKSIDPLSRRQGGDLGWLTKEQILKPIVGVIDTLKKGQLTRNPIKTHVGWHVLIVKDIRKGLRLPFEGVKGVLAEHIQAQKAMVYLAELRKKAKVQILETFARE